jgi:hypothetical protein
MRLCVFLIVFRLSISYEFIEVLQFWIPPEVYNLGNGGVPVHRDPVYPVHGIGANHEK